MSYPITNAFRGICFAMPLLLLSTVTSKAWTGKEAKDMWTGYNAKFYTTGSGGHIFVSNPGGGISNIWHFAEQIEMADDAYYFMANNYPTEDRSAYVTEINELCTGFTGNNGHLWTADPFNDDIIWAVMAFARANAITGNSTWLTDAENNFMAVWNRAQPINPANGQQITDGSWGLQQEGPALTGRLYAGTNYPFVMAGHILYDITGETRYRNPANAVYQWCLNNLYVYNAAAAQNGSGNVCSRIYARNDTELGGSIVIRDTSSDCGIAIDAATREGDNTAALTVANWLMYNVDYDNSGGSPYNGTYNGYNVLPNYTAGGLNNDTNDAGLNGIGLRGFWYALQRGVLTNPDATPWAQANVQCAWNNRDTAYNLTWCDWQTPTSGTRYSWGDSCAMVGMFDIPAPGGYN